MKRGKKILAIMLVILLVMPMTSAIGVAADADEATGKSASLEKSDVRKTEEKAAQKLNEEKDGEKNVKKAAAENADVRDAKKTNMQNMEESDVGKDSSEKAPVPTVKNITPKAKTTTVSTEEATSKELPEETEIPSSKEKVMTTSEKENDKKIDKDDESEITPASLLPLEEKKAYLVVGDHEDVDISAVPLKMVLSNLRDSAGNIIPIDENSAVVWSYYEDLDGNVIDEYQFSMTEGGTMDFSLFEGTERYVMELIIGSGKQLDPDNKRYIVTVYLTDNQPEFRTYEFYTQDETGKRTKIVPKDVIVKSATIAGTTTTGRTYIVPGHTKGKEYYLGVHSIIDEHPFVDLEVVTGPEYVAYLLGSAFGYDHPYATITDQILNKNMEEKDAGYKKTWDEPIISSESIDLNNTLYFIYKSTDGSVLYTDSETISIVDDAMDFNDEVNAYHDGKMENVRLNSTTQMTIDELNQDGYFFQATDTTNVRAIWLKEGYDPNAEYYLTFNITSKETQVEKAVVGFYNSIEDASNQPDIKDQLLGADKTKIPYGYKANYSKEKGGVPFTVFLEDGSVYKYLVVILDYNKNADLNVIHSYSEVPVVGKVDPWFRVIGAQDGQGRAVDTYVVENGKEINLDTMYGYGYQTIFIKGDSDKPTEIYPKFDFIKSDDVKIKNVFINGEPCEIGENSVALEPIQLNSQEKTVNFTVVIEDKNGEHQKTYHVTFVKKASDGPKLYVTDPKGGQEEDPVRAVFLTEYLEYKHDILIANLGNQPLTGLSVELNATHVKLDDYWTVGGERNNTLAPFNTTKSEDTQYGEIANIAKIRLLPDGEGEIEGTLTIRADGQEPVVIKLSGRAQQPDITTDKLKDAVKYVPYSYMITTNNMYDWNSVKFSLASGTLPEGMTLNGDTGEIYGAPLRAGTYTFTVHADYGREDYFEPSEKVLTITVLENENETVFKTSDEGYAIVPEENGMNGYIGEQVSDYEFVLTSVDEDEVYISDGEYGEFAKLWLNGEELTEGTDYDTEAGSTRITIRSQTLREKAKEGNNTISAEFNEDNKRGESLKRTSQNFRVDLSGKPNPSNPPDSGTETPTETPVTNTPGTENQTVNITTHIVNGSGSPLINYTVELHSAVQTERTNSSGNATFNGVEMGKHTFYVKNTNGATIATKRFTLIAGDKLAFDGDQITARPGQTIQMTITANGSNTSISNVSETRSTGGTANSTVNNTTGVSEKSSSKQVDSAKTGDETPVQSWMILALFAGVSVLGLSLMRKQGRN